MPTVYRFDGCRVVIYLNDHLPEHVHVVQAEKTAIFNLNCDRGPLTMRRTYGFSLPELNQIARRLHSQIQQLCAAWRKIHDQSKGI